METGIDKKSIFFCNVRILLQTIEPICDENVLTTVVLHPFTSSSPLGLTVRQTQKVETWSCFFLIFQRCGWYEMVEKLLSKLMIISSLHLRKLNACSPIAIVLWSLCPKKPNEFCQFGIIIITLAIYEWLVCVQVPNDLIKYNSSFPPSMTWTSFRNIDYRF